MHVNMLEAFGAVRANKEQQVRLESGSASGPFYIAGDGDQATSER